MNPHEARSVAESLIADFEHPNIAAIYGIEEAASTSAPSTDGDAERSQGSGQAINALVLELVKGPTLADRIKQGPIPLDEALPIARQIAEALAAAHKAGVIHRDLKPANIKVRHNGSTVRRWETTPSVLGRCDSSSSTIPSRLGPHLRRRCSPDPRDSP